ncbi:MAG: NUDIX domain-containing protein [Planctomycetota bacterium]|nr:NUDIX domain-containing protein [Planctomycetota bacterium]MDA1262177.1 NUDIX domain-containing protein [Planctomycetota bacterium]
MSHPTNPSKKIPFPAGSILHVALVALRRVRNEGGSIEILVAKRLKQAKILPGAWEIPGGKIEEGEPPTIAAARELLEETGVDCTDPSCNWLHIGVIEPPAPLGRPTPRFHIYSVELPTGAVPRALESSSIAWVDLAMLHKIDWPATNDPVVKALTEALNLAS